MAVELTWRGDEFRQQFQRATVMGLRACTAFYHTACRRAVAVPNSGVRKTRLGKQGRDEKGRFTKRKKTTRTIYPNPSRPGEPPRLRTGYGQRNVIQEFDATRPAGRVGVGKNAMYMFYLEIGTRRVKRRPWMLTTLKKNQAALARLAALGGQGAIGQ